MVRSDASSSIVPIEVTFYKFLVWVLFSLAESLILLGAVFSLVFDGSLVQAVLWSAFAIVFPPLALWWPTRSVRVAERLRKHFGLDANYAIFVNAGFGRQTKGGVFNGSDLMGEGVVYLHDSSISIVSARNGRVLRALPMNEVVSVHLVSPQRWIVIEQLRVVWRSGETFQASIVTPGFRGVFSPSSAVRRFAKEVRVASIP